MTNPLDGPSLLQARHSHFHSHSHSHSHLHNRDSHNHDSLHARSPHAAAAAAALHNVPRDETADLDPRDTITEVIQTISVVQVIDGAGATLSAHTLPGYVHTDLVDSDTGSTISANVFAASAAPTTDDDDGDDTPATSLPTEVFSVDPVSASLAPSASATPSVPDSTPAVTDSTTTGIPSATEEPSGTATSIPAELSLTHISSSSSFSTLASASNSTTSSSTTSSSSSSLTSSILSSLLPSTNSSQTSTTLSSSSTASQSLLFSSSVDSFLPSTTFASSTISSTPSPFSSPTSTWTIDPDSSTTFLSPSDSASATFGGGSGGDGSGDGTATASAGSSSTAAASGGSGGDGAIPATTSKVVGGIFGGIAGIALLVGLAFMILRMKKTGWGKRSFLPGRGDGSDDAQSRALPAATGGGGGGDDGDGNDGSGPSGAYGTMGRSAPQTVAASLAALAGKRSSRERAGSSGEMAERGFVRVSGRKLPPVLQYGGDGYSDPRQSVMSDGSASVYRDSMAVFTAPNAARLALGSPMRPESGIMTMQPGPARTPVTASTTHIDSPTLPRSSTFPAAGPPGQAVTTSGNFARESLTPDFVGRTLAAHDYSRDGADSRGSHTSRGSTRFTEQLS